MADPNASDWSDLDLLTLGEAAERLAAEIGVVRAELDAMGGDDLATRSARAAGVSRLHALHASLNQMKRP